MSGVKACQIRCRLRRAKLEWRHIVKSTSAVARNAVITTVVASYLAVNVEFAAPAGRKVDGEVTLGMGRSSLPPDGKERVIVTCAAIAAASVCMCPFRSLRLLA
jgi:hypothetical protein